MRRIAYAILITALAFIIVSCKADPVCECPTPGVTPSQETATWTPEPTVTPVPTLRPDEGVYETPLNFNTWELFVDRVEAKYPGIDGRYQCIPRGGDFIWSSRPVAGGDTPPYINCDETNRLGGVHNVEVHHIAGTYTWLLNDPVQVYDGLCYRINVIGDNRTVLKTGESDQLFSAGVIYEDGLVLRRLPFYRFPADNDLMLEWIVKPTRDTIITIEAGFVINFAVYDDESVIVVDEIYIERLFDDDLDCSRSDVGW